MFSKNKDDGIIRVVVKHKGMAATPLFVGVGIGFTLGIYAAAAAIVRKERNENVKESN